MSQDRPEVLEQFRGPWCEAGIGTFNGKADEADPDQKAYQSHLRRQWEEALREGDLKEAHKRWGKWQSFICRDPWADEGWRRFWEVQRMGQELWEEFDASTISEKLILRTRLSYCTDFDED